MSIFLNADSKVIVQGITGGEGTKHTALMLKAGTQVVGGVNARKAGTTVSHKNKDGNDVELPVFASVAEAIKETVGAGIGLDSGRVAGDLERFKDLVESRELPTGAWRGEIESGDVVADDPSR